MTQEEIEELKTYFPIDVFSEEELNHCKELSKNGYIPVVKYIKSVHPELSFKEARIYNDLYFDNKL